MSCSSLTSACRPESIARRLARKSTFISNQIAVSSSIRPMVLPRGLEAIVPPTENLSKPMWAATGRQ